MKTLIYEIEIKAPRARVWNTLIDKDKYKSWSKAFSSNSDYKGKWEEGAEIEFIDVGRGGTVARIEKIKPQEFVSAVHIATLTKDMIRETKGEFTEKWIGTKEIYHLIESNDHTLLRIEMHSHEDIAPMFEEPWPKALENIKRLAESKD